MNEYDNAQNKNIKQSTTRQKKKTIQPKDNKKITIGINITQMMLGKQWVKSWGMYSWTGEASIHVKEVEASSNNGYEAESKAFYHNISLQKQKKQAARAENNV